MLKSNINETIVALSTSSMGLGAISIVRLSGDKSIEIADKLFTSLSGKKPNQFTARTMELGTLSTQDIKDNCLCVVFKAPNSFTGENLVEFQTHGGTKIAENIIKECINCGARMAGNGEFTKRAFLNGKMTLASAEGMMDMINAESEAEIRAGYSLLGGELNELANSSQKELTDILSEIEVSFDYPEEQIEYITKTNAKSRLQTISNNINTVLECSKNSGIIKNGIKVLILGKPNVGKSSLLNKLIGKERAIVTDIPGTTRDSIEDTFTINGVKFIIIDTAGIREASDKVEQIGVDKAKEQINAADIILFVQDASRPYDAEDQSILNLIKDKNYIVIKNKADLINETEIKDLAISAATGAGIDILKDTLYNKSVKSKINTNGLIITSQRHYDCLQRAKEHLDQAISNIDNDTLDLITIDLNLAYSCLGEITGNTTGEDIIDAIFSKFCLGK